jgi:hypothetical protein
MRAIEVSVNGKRVCVAGSEEGELTFLHVTLDERDAPKATVMVAGSRGKEVPIWVEDYAIGMDDVVLVRVVECDATDKPVRSERAWQFPPPGFSETPKVG